MLHHFCDPVTQMTEKERSPVGTFKKSSTKCKHFF